MAMSIFGFLHTHRRNRRDSSVPDRAQSSLSDLLEYAPRASTPEERVVWFVDFVSWVRPRNNERARTRVTHLRSTLTRNPAWRENVVAMLRALAGDVDLPPFLAYAGIARDFHFWGAVSASIAARVLPTPCRTRDIQQIARLAFRERDLLWLADSGLVVLLRELTGEAFSELIALEARQAMLDLAHQLAAQASAPAVRELTTGTRSPFRGLYAAVAAFCEAPGEGASYEQLRGRTRQCVIAIESFRASLVERGADLNTTFQLLRMERQFTRLTTLAHAAHEPSDYVITNAFVHFVQSALDSHARLFDHSSQLLMQNLVDTTAGVGRNYLDHSESWVAAFRAGAGGGVLMAVATVVKFAIAALHLPTLYEGIAFGLNYAAAFCAAYLLHYTIATKLPAHTATALARLVQNSDGHRARVKRFVEAWRGTLRMQIAGLVGNLAVVAPLVFLLDAGFRGVFGHHIASPEKAQSVMHANAILGPSVLYAALAGLFLWGSSLIGASADNWMRVNRLADGLATSLPAMRNFGVERATNYARALISRMGGLTGNFALGMVLGVVPAVFAILQLPVDIRHVTVSAGSITLGVAGGVHALGPVLQAVLGVLAIGTVNVIVSFSFALWLALRFNLHAASRRRARAFVRVCLRRWLRASDYARPGTSPASVSAAPASNHAS